MCGRFEVCYRHLKAVSKSKDLLVLLIKCPFKKSFFSVSEKSVLEIVS